MNIPPSRGEYRVVVTGSDNPEFINQHEYSGCTLKMTMTDAGFQSLGLDAAITAYDDLLGTVVGQEWFEDGLEHRSNGLPASIKNDGKHTTYDWYTHGRLLRSVTISNRTMQAVTKVHYNDPPNGQSWGKGFTSDFIATIDHYDEDTGAFKSRRFEYSGKTFDNLKDAPNLPFPIPDV